MFLNHKFQVPNSKQISNLNIDGIVKTIFSRKVAKSAKKKSFYYDKLSDFLQSDMEV